MRLDGDPPIGYHYGMGKWYRVIKTIKGNRYLYEQQTFRESGRVKTRNRYLGRADQGSGSSGRFANTLGSQITP